MKNIFAPLILVTFLAPCIGCKKSFLDVPITKDVVAEEYVTNLSRAEEFFNGIIVLLAKEIGNYKNVIYADIAADNLKPTGPTAFDYYSWNQLTQNGTNFDSYWLANYNAIRNCNFLLERIDQFSSENPAKASAIKGQLLALRGLFHFHLTVAFAQPMTFSPDGTNPGVPYDTTYAEEKTMERIAVKEDYRLIVADFERALPLIPTSYTGMLPTGVLQQTWLSRDAATALLARIVLFQGDIGHAKSLSRSVALNNPLMSNADYPAKLYTPVDKESLFWAPPIQASTGSTLLFQGYYFINTSTYAASLDLVNLIKENPSDKRNTWFKQDATTSHYQILKFPQGAVPGVTDARTAYYQTIVRNAEMYLTSAECYAKMGNEDSARYFLDAIRKRADISAASSTATGVALMDSIYKERRKELCFENLRLYDLLRQGRGVQRKDVVAPAPAQLPFPSDKSIAPLPIVDVVTYKFKQNPGYQ